jgi:hypothetical protein
MNRPASSSIAVAFVLGLMLVPLAKTPAVAQPVECERTYCVEDEVTLPGSRPADPDTSTAEPISAGGREPKATPPRCGWTTNPGQMTNADGSPGFFPDVGPPPSDDAYLEIGHCDGRLAGTARWVDPGAPQPADDPPAPTGPPAAQLAETIRVRLEGDLPQPTVTTSPPLGEPAVVNHPTFLAIDNWTGSVTDSECNGLLCVTVTATPTLTWDPGEPTASTITCTGAGTTYDPGSSPQTQARQPGACAHTYTARTGTPDRATQWPGTATTTWSLNWTSTTGDGGPMPPIAHSSATPRAVEEVQAVVALTPHRQQPGR